MGVVRVVLASAALGVLVAGVVLWALPARHVVSLPQRVVVAPGVPVPTTAAEPGVFADASALLGGVPRAAELAETATATLAGDLLVVRAEGASFDEAAVVAGALGTAVGRRLTQAAQAGRPANRPVLVLSAEGLRDEGRRPAPGAVLAGGAVVGLVPGLVVAGVRSRRRGGEAGELGRLPRSARDPAVRGRDERAAAAARRVGSAVATAVGSSRVVAVVAVEPQSGPVSAAAEIATALADAGERVLLVESGPGSSTSPVRRVADPTPGIREVLAGSAETTRAIRRWERGGIDVLPTGRPGPPLAGDDVSEVLAPLRGLYDRIVLDVPGAPGARASAELAAAADAGVRVEGRTVREVVRPGR